MDIQQAAMIKFWVLVKVTQSRRTLKTVFWLDLQKKDRNLTSSMCQAVVLTLVIVKEKVVQKVPWPFQWSSRQSQCQACREGALILWHHSGFPWSAEGGVRSGWSLRLVVCMFVILYFIHVNYCVVQFQFLCVILFVLLFWHVGKHSFTVRGISPP